MVRTVIWTEAAFRDLEGAHRYIAQDSPRYAMSLSRAIVKKVRSLSRLAERGAMVPEFGDEQIREVRVAKYRLIYRIVADRVVLLGVIHGARDLQQLWEDDDR